ncbi:MAG: hypothetical protein F6K55_47270 [Moorea sp. SIO4A3]|nr:hypothetical protein [Moorena sp. SIO4A3]
MGSRGDGKMGRWGNQQLAPQDGAISRLPIPDSRLPTPDSRLPTPRFEAP